MAKIILSPLFIALLSLWLLLLWQLWRVRKRNISERIICMLSVFFLLMLTLFSFVNVSRWLQRSLELPEAYLSKCPFDAVVVLGAGIMPGKDGFGEDKPNGDTALRVIKGVEVYKECGAKWLVMSGRSKDEPRERDGEVMRGMAVMMGVPSDRILLEMDSNNTREHPVRLAAMNLFDSASRLAIVTSPWHLRRAMIEFKRYYPNAMPVAAYYLPTTFSGSYMAWLPQSYYLDATTEMVREFIGMLWYRIKSQYI